MTDQRLLKFGLSLLFCCLPVVLFAQCDPLTTLYAQNNGQDGIMFDITALVDVTVTGFDCNLGDEVNPYNMEIYHKTGTHEGFTQNAGVWTLVGSANNVVGLGEDIPTPIPIVLDIAIPQGQVGAFYITEAGGTPGIDYTNGTAVGNVYITDGNISVHEGTGKNYPFDTDFTPRVPNITIYYDCCPPPDTIVTHNSCLGAANGSVEVIGHGVAPWVYEIEDLNGVFETSPSTNGSYVFQDLIEGQYVITVSDSDGCSSSITVTIMPTGSVSFEAYVTDNVCYGGIDGEATITVNGGTAPMNIVWTDPFANPLQINTLSNGISTIDSLSAGIYLVSVQDDLGCIGDTSITVIEPQSPLTITLSTLDLTCYESSDGQIDVSYDGIPPYVYEVFDVVGNPIQSASDTGIYTFTDFEAGIYFVTATDADGCFQTDNVEVDQPDALTVETAMSPVLCFNGNEGFAAVTSISGGTPPYEVPVWSDPLQQTGDTAYFLSEGAYTVEVLDANACMIQAGFEFDNPPPLTLAPRYLTDTCGQGKGAAIVDAELGTPPYTYLWKPDSVTTQIQYNLFEGIYEVVVTDANSCKDSTFVEVKDDLPYPFAAFEYRIEGESMIDQEVQFVNNSVGTSQWTWYFGNGETSNEEDPRFHFGRAGDYLVQLISSTGYCEDTAYQYVNIDPLLTVYIPNAFTPGQNNKNDYFFPQGEGIELESYDMFIFDRWGKIIWQTGNFSKKWDGSNLEGNEVAMGTYFYKITLREYADLDRHVYTGIVHVIRD